MSVQLSSQGSHQSVIPVLSPFADYGRNGISCQLVNKSILWNQSTIKSVKFANVSHCVVQRVSGNRFEQHMAYVPHGECNCIMLFLLVLIVSRSENLSDVS